MECIVKSGSQKAYAKVHSYMQNFLKHKVMYGNIIIWKQNKREVNSKEEKSNGFMDLYI